MNCEKPITLHEKEDGYVNARTVPCGSCFACLSKRAQEWGFRLEQELKTSSAAIFLTLTLGDAECAKKGQQTVNLEKATAQKFLKRLRNNIAPDTFKYYLVGEYGPKNLRPHYHAIIFNLDPKHHETVKTSWGLGFIQIRPISTGRIRYVTGYIIGKNFFPENLTKPFALMSKGLGLSYLEEKYNYHKENLINHVTYPGGMKGALPRYYKDKIFDKYEKSYNAIQNLQKDEEKYAKHINKIREQYAQEDRYFEQSREQYNDRIIRKLNSKKL